jgi:hypothetical protein
VPRIDADSRTVDAVEVECGIRERFCGRRYGVLADAVQPLGGVGRQRAPRIEAADFTGGRMGA